MMKRTKNMVYNETTEARELYLYADNDAFCYEHIIMPAVKNLKKKAAKGIYDIEKAVDAFYYVATECAKQYQKDFGSLVTGKMIFSVTDRFTCAVDLEENFREIICEEE